MADFNRKLAEQRELAAAPTLGNMHPNARAQAIARSFPMGAPYGIIDPDYARVFTKTRIIAWQYGYACVMHGSFTRDLDLLLVPWEERAYDNGDQLLKLIAQACDLRFRDGVEDIYKATVDWSPKPHGRRACSLFFPKFGDRRWIDISIAPCVSKGSAAGEAEYLSWQHGDGVADTRTCTCHPDDNPPKPCPRKFALSDCRAAASGVSPAALGDPKL